MDIGQIVQAINATPLDKGVKTDAINALKPYAGQINTLLEYEPKMAPGQDLPRTVADYAIGIIAPVLQSSGVPKQIRDEIGMGIYTTLGGTAYVEGTKFL